jgi:hypothetical protein
VVSGLVTVSLPEDRPIHWPYVEEAIVESDVLIAIRERTQYVSNSRR